MSEFKRKTQTGGFEASEDSFVAQEHTEARPDFGALEAESGFSVDAVEEPVQRANPAVEPAEPIERRSKRAVEPFPAQPDAEPPAKKKRYYNPGEVMKKKGCIGCGGMALVIPVMLAVLALAIALF